MQSSSHASSTASPQTATRRSSFISWLDRQAPYVFVLPTVLLILAFSIFPLVTSAYLSLLRFSLGEGGYEQSERVLQQLLNEAGATDTGSELVSVDASGAEVAADWDDLESTETYLGFGRATGFASSGGVQRDSSREYAAPAALRVNHWALSGKWRFENEAVVLGDDRGSIVYKWHARDLHLVGDGTRIGGYSHSAVGGLGKPAR